MIGKEKLNHVFGIIIVVLVLFTFGCKEKTEQLVYPSLPALVYTDTINFIGHWLGEGKREELVKNIAREYEFKNQNVLVNLKFPEEIYFDPNNRNSNEQFNANILLQKNPKWDIIRINDEYESIRRLLNDPDWTKKFLVDFSQIPEFRNNTRQELLTNEAKKKWNGIIPGPYVEGVSWSMWCNKKVAEKIGIQVKQFGMTVNDFLGYLKAVNQYNVHNPNEPIYAIYESDSWKTTFAIALQIYSSMLNSPDEFFSAKVSEKRLDAWGKTLEIVEEMASLKPLNPFWRKLEWDESKYSLLKEEYLFYVNGSWMYNIWLSENAEKTLDCVPTEFPRVGNFTAYPASYSIVWAVLKNAPHKDEAIKFLLAVNKPDFADVWVRNTKCPTGVNGSLSDASLGTDQFESFYNYIQSEYSNCQYKIMESAHWVLDERFSDFGLLHYMDVLEGKITAGEAMHLIRKTVQQ